MVEPSFMACLIASHVSSTGRVQALRRLLHSITQQQPSPPRVFLSWHATSPHADTVRALLDESSFLVHFEQPKPLSQFQHFANLVARIKYIISRPDWVCFSDDDDLWSERRSAILARACQMASPSTSTLCSRRKARPHSQAHSPPGAPPADAAAVRALLSRGLAMLTDAQRREENKRRSGFGALGGEHTHMIEYFDCACRFRVLERWVKSSCPTPVLQHKLCDLAFTAWLRQSYDVQYLLPEGSDADDFMYFYDVSLCAEERASTRVDVELAEVELANKAHSAAIRGDGAAAAALRLLCRLCGCSNDEIGSTAAKGATARFLAELRQNLEQEIVQTRIGGAVVPAQVIDSLCSRQLQLTLLNLAATRKLGADGAQRLEAWAASMARDTLAPLLLERLSFDALVCWDRMQVTHLINTSRTEEDVMAQVLREYGGGQ